MAVLKNRAKMSTSATGTGSPITLGSAEDGYQTFADAGVANADVVRYVIEDTGGAFEIGTGTYTSSGTTLSRTVSESSNSNNAINLSGSATVFIGATAEDIPALYAANESSPTAQPSATGANAVAIGDSAAASGDDGFAIGEFVTASGRASLSMISNSTASGQYATSIGDQTVASGRSSIAMGYHGDATANFAVAIGNSSTGHGPQATALGAMALGGAKASGTDSLAVQNQDTSGSYGAQGANSIAMGQLAKATGTASVKIGRMGTIAGDYSVGLGNGGTTTSSGTFSVALQATSLNAAYSLGFGSESQVDSGHDRSIVLGRGARSRTKGGVHFGGYNAINAGQNQAGIYVLASDTTDATAEALTTNNSTASSDNQIILPNSSAYSFSGTIIARESAAAGSDYASWEIKGALLRDANAASTVLGNGIQNKLYATSGASAWAIALSADTTNGGLKIEVTGAASTNIRWVATVNTSEVTYA